VEVELEDVGSIRRQHLLEVANEVVTLRPHRLRDEIVHPHHQDILVLGAIEDYHLAFGRGVQAARIENRADAAGDRALCLCGRLTRRRRVRR
jgi:hypothetical protein